MAKKTVNQEMQIKTRKISDLIRAEYNPRELTKEQQNQLTDSLKRFGLVDPIIVNTHKDRKNILVGGHQRMKVWESMGNETIPTVEVNLNLEKEKELNVRLNKNTGQFDMELIQEHFETDDLIEWGFDAEELEFFEPEVLEAEEDDYSVPDEIKTDIVLGDLIEIGKHRLLCGDSTCSDTVAKLMNGEKADIAFTSPPYNAAKNSHLNGRVKGFDEKYQNKNDAKTDDEYLKFLYDFTINTTTFSNYSFVNIQMLAQNKFTLLDYQYEVKTLLKDILIWNKSICPPNIVKGAFNTKWEYVFCFSEKNETRGFPCKWQGKFPNVIETENASGNNYADIHKATFPISFPSWIIEKMDFAKSVLDVFCGTGTTMVAAHQLKRKCYGMELDPKYCQVIVDRMMKLDESLTVKINGKSYKK